MLIRLSFANSRTVLLLVKTLLLLLPLAWTILSGPHAYILLSAGGIVASIDLFRKGLLAHFLRAWPIAVLALLYLATRWIAPDVTEEGARPYDSAEVLITLIYGLSTGVCLASWSQNEGQKPVLLGYAFFCLALAVAAETVATALIDNHLSLRMNDEFVRQNSDTAIQYWNFFEIENVIIGVIPMTVFGVAGTVLVLVPGWNWHKLFMVLAGAAGFYANVQVATRTALLAAGLTIACLTPSIVYRNSKQRGGRLRVALLCLAFAGIIGFGIVGVASTNQYSMLLDRFSEISDDSRKYVWGEAIGLLWRYPMGGGILRLKSEPWAHNIFLDLGLTNGFPGMLFMAAAYALMMRLMWRAIRWAGMLGEPLGVVLVAGFVASFFVCLTVPPSPPLITFHYIVAAFSLVSLHARKRSDLEPLLESEQSGLTDAFPHQYVVTKAKL